MIVELLSIGTELLAGVTLNTNISFLSYELLKLGIEVKRHTVLPDDESHLEQGLQEILLRADLILCTGGLGPTCDDLTRQVVARLFKTSLTYNEAVATELYTRYGPSLISLKDQATLPQSAYLFPNKVGTAPGLLLKNGHATLIMMPGVPAEMKPMFTGSVAEYLKEHFLPQEKLFRKQIHFFKLKEEEVDVALRTVKDKYPSVEFGIYPSEGLLGISLSVRAENETEVESQLKKPIEELVKSFPDHYFDAPSGKIEEAVHQYLTEHHKTIAIAESCTGGALAARLTSLSGASNYFLGSVTAYSNFAKNKILHVKEETLKQHGAVSEQAVREMAQGVMQLMESDYAIAVSGIAGPTGATPDKPVGTIWFAICGKDMSPISWLYKARGERETIIRRSVNEALSSFLLTVTKN